MRADASKNGCAYVTGHFISPQLSPLPPTGVLISKSRAFKDLKKSWLRTHYIWKKLLSCYDDCVIITLRMEKTGIKVSNIPDHSFIS